MNILNDAILQRILSPADDPSNPHWSDALRRLASGDMTFTRKSAGEHSIAAIQRLLVFLGYSTSSRGAFIIDGDFGRGTNRAVAQFQFEHQLNDSIYRKTLCYPCSFRNAHKRISTIPETRLTIATLQKMGEIALAKAKENDVLCGDINEAIHQLNALHARRLMTCNDINNHFGALLDEVIKETHITHQQTLQPEWVLAIIKQETGGVVRPRFEQHKLSAYHQRNPTADFTELRYRSMSQGLGQVMGEHFVRVGAASAKAMYVSPLKEQIRFVVNFLLTSNGLRSVVAKRHPKEADFRRLARHYNGPSYETHHYHERIEHWYQEFIHIRM